MTDTTAPPPPPKKNQTNNQKKTPEKKEIKVSGDMPEIRWMVVLLSIYSYMLNSLIKCVILPHEKEQILFK